MADWAGIRHKLRDLNKYNQSFRNILSSRGISNNSIREIEEAGCSIVLETETKKELEPPRKLQDFLNEKYQGAEEIIIKKVSLSKNSAIIKIGVSSNSAWKESKKKRVLIPYPLENIVWGKVLIFDFQKSILKKPFIKIKDDENETGWIEENFPQILFEDFAKLAEIVTEKHENKISIYKNEDPVIQGEFLKQICKSKKLKKRRLKRKRYKMDSLVLTINS